MKAITRRTFLKRSLAFSAGTSAGLAGIRALGAEPAFSSATNQASPNPVPIDPYADGKLVDGPPPPLSKGAFTIAVLPDTQYYSESFPATYKAQTRWIVEQKKDRNIACVLHLGDLTNQNTPEQWKNAADAMSLLDGNVPYFLVPGNHDYYGDQGNWRTELTNYFPVAKFERLRTFGGVYDQEPARMENSFHLFSAGGRKFLVLCLEFGPRRDVIRWANEVVDKHRDREAILVTHAFTYSDNTRYDWAKRGAAQTWNPHSYGIVRNNVSEDVADGEQLWQELVSRHDSFIFTINGHVCNDGLGRLASPRPDGRDVHQVLVNFQIRPQGGDGWLRLLEMCPDGTMNAVDYSPTRRQCNESPKNKFSVRLARA
jgi:3',5'-cyclic AMP phosphodiesterase CpdA